MSTKVYTSSVGRISWLYVFGEGNPDKKYPDGSDQFSLTLMVPKNLDAFGKLGISEDAKKKHLASADAFVTEVRKDAGALAKEKFKGKWKETRHDPFIDGDKKTRDDEAEEGWDGNANFWLLRMKTKFQPKVMQPKASMGKIEDGNDDPQTGAYSGMWGRVKLTLGSYNVDGNKGVCVYLGKQIQKAFNDELFGSDEEPMDDIEEMEETMDDFEDEGGDELE